MTEPDKWCDAFKKCMCSISDAKETIIKCHVFITKCLDDKNMDYETVHTLMLEGIQEVANTLSGNNDTIEYITIPEAIYYIVRNRSKDEASSEVKKLHEYGRFLSKMRVYKDCANNEYSHIGRPKYERINYYLNMFN